jgi:hypothetical protein
MNKRRGLWIIVIVLTSTAAARYLLTRPGPEAPARSTPPGIEAAHQRGTDQALQFMADQPQRGHTYPGR